MKPKILIISDEPETAKIWGFSLSQVGMDVRLIGIHEDAMQTWSEELPDIIIIEDFNAEVEELDLCRQLRMETVVPILYLTAKPEEGFLLETYRAGADETIPFPITPRLFQAKVKAWLRQTQSLPLAALEELKRNGFLLNVESRKLTTLTGQVIHLSVLESRLLYILFSAPGKAFEANKLIERIWGYYGEGNNNLLKVLIYRLRRKIEPDPSKPRYLVTVGNLGYKFEAEESINKQDRNN